MTQPKGYVDSDYLRFVAPSVSHLKRRTYELLELRAGKKVLDVGCGPASDTVEMGRLVGPQGQVIGVDRDQAMIDEAESRAREAGVAAWVEHRRAESNALPFESGQFDAVRSERLFQHLPDPRPTLMEMIRVARSGGLVLVLDTDWGSGSIDTTEIDIERRLARARAEHVANNGFAGRQLFRLFKEAGLNGVRVEVYANSSTDYAFYRRATLANEGERVAVAEGLVTRQEVQQIHAQWERADAEGAFFGSVNQMLVVGRRP